MHHVGRANRIRAALASRLVTGCGKDLWRRLGSLAGVRPCFRGERSPSHHKGHTASDHCKNRMLLSTAAIKSLMMPETAVARSKISIPAIAGAPPPSSGPICRVAKQASTQKHKLQLHSTRSPTSTDIASTVPLTLLWQMRPEQRRCHRILMWSKHDERTYSDGCRASFPVLPASGYRHLGEASISRFAAAGHFRLPWAWQLTPAQTG